MKFWGQLIGLIAMSAIILSFQCKSNKRLATVMGIGALLFAASYFLLGQSSAALFNIITVICSIMCMKDSLKNEINFGIIVALFVVSTIFTYSGWWSLVLMTAQILASYSIMFGSGTFIRNMRFFFVLSPQFFFNLKLFHNKKFVLKSQFPTKKKQSFLEKWLIPGLRNKMYSKSLKHLVILESKQVLKKNQLDYIKRT